MAVFAVVFAVALALVLIWMGLCGTCAVVFFLRSHPWAQGLILFFTAFQTFGIISLGVIGLYLVYHLAGENINHHSFHYVHVVFHIVRQWTHRPRRGAQVPPHVPPQGGPINPQVQQFHAHRMDFMPPQLNGRILHDQNQQYAQRDIGLRDLHQPGVPIRGVPINSQVQKVHAPRMDVMLPQLNGHIRHVQNQHGIAEGMGAPPLRRSERIRAKKEAEERAQPVLRRSARIQAKREVEQRKVQQLQQIKRNRAF